MARAPKRQQPKYVSYNHEGTDYVVDLANHEVLKDWVAIERQAMPGILAGARRAHPESVAC